MTKDEIKAEISKLEAEFAQLVVNSHVIQGAKIAYHKVLAVLEAKEKTTVTEVKEDITKDLTSEAKKLEAQPE